MSVCISLHVAIASNSYCIGCIDSCARGFVMPLIGCYFSLSILEFVHPFHWTVKQEEMWLYQSPHLPERLPVSLLLVSPKCLCPQYTVQHIEGYLWEDSHHSRVCDHIRVYAHTTVCRDRCSFCLYCGALLRYGGPLRSCPGSTQSLSHNGAHWSGGQHTQSLCGKVSSCYIVL